MQAFRLEEAVPRTMVSVETKKALKEISIEQQVPIAHIVRQALKDYLAKHRSQASVLSAGYETGAGHE